MELLHFSSLSAIPHFRHAVTTRSGGVSGGEFSSLNLAFHVHDDEAGVQENRRLLATQLGYSADRLVAAQQVHGSEVYIVAPVDAGRGSLDWSSAIQGTDALVTDRPNMPLLILVADCAPILLVDPTRCVFAVVHAGWRGAVARIASKTVATMNSQFGSCPTDIKVGIGPCLCPHNLEVGFEVAEQVEPIVTSAIVKGQNKPHLDLRELIRQDLSGAGVVAQNIEAMPFCSRDDQRFFSHRGQNGTAGRFGIVAWWEKYDRRS